MLLALPAGLSAADQMAPERNPDDQIEALTMDVLRLQRDWLELREWPSESPERRIEVYLTASLPERVSVNSLSLILDGNTRRRHEYSAEQLAALRSGAAHRVYLGAIDPGTHLLDARIEGWDGMGRNYTTDSRLSFRKLGTSKLLELHVLALEPGQRPDIIVRQWD